MNRWTLLFVPFCLMGWAAQATADQYYRSHYHEVSRPNYYRSSYAQVDRYHHSAPSCRHGTRPVPIYQPAPVVVRRPAVAVPVYVAPPCVARPQPHAGFYYSRPGLYLGIDF